MATSETQMPSAENKFAAGGVTAMPLTESNLAIHDKCVQPQEHTYETICEWVEAAKPRHLYPSQRSLSDLSWMEGSYSSFDDDTSKGRAEGTDGSKLRMAINPFRYEPSSIVRPGGSNPEDINYSRDRALWAKGLEAEQERRSKEPDNHDASNSQGVLSTDLALDGLLILPAVPPEQMDRSRT
ncbi:hypothetical protein BJX63DRAFT_430698 [Aspergillus granulosus]|uniref:Uncharacterized protein n=1 Tax=Aspergillus granulosus TaxID=176169 RepID=A0ABR4HJ04_9EURO